MKKKNLVNLFLLAFLSASWGCSSSQSISAHRLTDDSESVSFVDSSKSTSVVQNYQDALVNWKSAEDINEWIGKNFQYDMGRALSLAENQKAKSGRFPIYAPEDFFQKPSGVCVDLSRFAFEALNSIRPDLKAQYLMIEFDPIEIQGSVLRRHWLVAYREGENIFLFADSKRPGVISGPYLDIDRFIEEYQVFRGRKIVSYRLLDTYLRQRKKRRSH